jgi:hypothetical protein
VHSHTQCCDAGRESEETAYFGFRSSLLNSISWLLDELQVHTNYACLPQPWVYFVL